MTVGMQAGNGADQGHPVRSALSPSRLHPAAWMAWTASAAAVGLLVRNPWYLAILGTLAIALHARLTAKRLNWPRLRLYLSLVAFPGLLNLFLSRVGDTVLLHLPLRWIGGPYTLEGLLFGLSAGVQIASLMAVFSVFGAAVKPTDILRRMPRGLYPVGLSASIALTVAPQARRSFVAIQEAHQVRGRQPRGLRDLPGIVTPLVVLSLEGAMGLAEGMVARGWQGDGPPRGRGWLAAAGWLLLSAAVVVVLTLPAGGLAGIGLLLLAVAFLAGGRSRRPAEGRYRPDVWRGADTLLSGVALGVLAVCMFLAAAAPAALAYYPYPRAAWPDFAVGVALAVLLLGLPLCLPGTRGAHAGG